MKITMISQIYTILLNKYAKFISFWENFNYFIGIASEQIIIQMLGYSK